MTLKNAGIIGFRGSKKAADKRQLYSSFWMAGFGTSDFSTDSQAVTPFFKLYVTFKYAPTRNGRDLLALNQSRLLLLFSSLRNLIRYSRGIRRSCDPGIRYPLSRPESNHLETVRGATLQILATCPVVKTFMLGSP